LSPTDQSRYHQLKRKYPPISDNEFVFPKDEASYQRGVEKRLDAQKLQAETEASFRTLLDMLGRVIGIGALVVLGGLLVYRIVLFAFTGHFTR
jgi:hypothetical protein